MMTTRTADLLMKVEPTEAYVLGLIFQHYHLCFVNEYEGVINIIS